MDHGGLQILDFSLQIADGAYRMVFNLQSAICNPQSAFPFFLDGRAAPAYRGS
jgi:hypothetical protein